MWPMLILESITFFISSINCCTLTDDILYMVEFVYLIVP